MIKVIILTKNNRKIITKFGRRMKSAKKFRRLVKEEAHSHIRLIALVDMSKIKHPPKGELKEWGKLWCPYCAKQREFKPDYRGDDYIWCIVCGISDADFYVKSFNQLWGGSSKSDFFGTVSTIEDSQEAINIKKQRRKDRAAKREAKRNKKG